MALLKRVQFYLVVVTSVVKSSNKTCVPWSLNFGRLTRVVKIKYSSYLETDNVGIPCSR